jgi:hypothetical protein
MIVILFWSGGCLISVNGIFYTEISDSARPASENQHRCVTRMEGNHESDKRNSDDALFVKWDNLFASIRKHIAILPLTSGLQNRKSDSPDLLTYRYDFSKLDWHCRAAHKF